MDPTPRPFWVARLPTTASLPRYVAKPEDILLLGFGAPIRPTSRWGGHVDVNSPKARQVDLVTQLGAVSATNPEVNSQPEIARRSVASATGAGA